MSSKLPMSSDIDSYIDRIYPFRCIDVSNQIRINLPHLMMKCHHFGLVQAPSLIKIDVFLIFDVHLDIVRL